VLVSQTNYPRDARGLFSTGSRGGTRAGEDKGTGRPYLYGVVVHAHRNVSLFFNRSTNYQAVNQSDRTIDDRFLPALTGRGLDAGVKIFAFGDRLTGSIRLLRDAAENVRDGTLPAARPAG